MPTPTRALTNNHNDCKLIKLGTSDPKSPLTVAQEGYAPSDATCRMRMFYLQRDGFWIDGIATQPAGFRAPFTLRSHGFLPSARRPARPRSSALTTVP